MTTGAWRREGGSGKTGTSPGHPAVVFDTTPAKYELVSPPSVKSRFPVLLLTEQPSRGDAPEVLMIRTCAHCETLLSPGSSACDACGGVDLPKVPSTGLGEIRTWTVIDREPPDRCGDSMPCLLAVVALDDGPWICTWLEGEIAVRSDQHVRVQFHHAASGDRYPVFCASGTDRDAELLTG